MIAFLAEMSVAETTWINGAIVALPTIASAVTAWFVITGRGKNPQPFEVKGQTRIATWDELVETRERIEKLDHQMGEMRVQISETERRLQTEGSRRAANIHKRIEQLDHDIDGVPGRVVAMLKDTKGLI